MTIENSKINIRRNLFILIDDFKINIYDIAYNYQIRFKDKLLVFKKH